MNSGAYKALEEAGHVPGKPPSDVNELDVHIIRCCGVLPRRHGTYMSLCLSTVASICFFHSSLLVTRLLGYNRIPGRVGPSFWPQ